MEEIKPSFVYLLLCDNNNSYVGATNNLARRLRQHNGEIKGGAHATTNMIKKGLKWSRACYVSGFPDWPAALQFEWRWKQISRKNNIHLLPLERRMKALVQLISLEKSTSKAIPFDEWSQTLGIHFENENAHKYYLEQQTINTLKYNVYTNHYQIDDIESSGSK